MLLVCPNCSTSYQLKIATFGASGREVRCARCRHVWIAHDPGVEPAAAIGTQSDAAPEGDGFRAPDKAAEAVPPVTRTPAAGLEAPVDEVLERADHATPMIDDAPPLAPQEADSAGPAVAAAPAGKSRIRAAIDRMPKFSLPGIPIPPLPIPNRVRTVAARYRGFGARVKPIYVVAALAVIVAALMYERANIVHMLPQMASLYEKFGAETNLRGLVFDELKAMTEVDDGKTVLLIEGTIHNITGATVDVPRLRFAVRNADGADLYSWTALPERSPLKSGERMRFQSRLASPPKETRDAYVRFFTRNDVAAGNP